MKKLVLLGALALLPILVQAQYSNYPGVLPFAGVPSGSCALAQLAVNTSNGNLYTCLSGSWSAVASNPFSSGGTTIGAVPKSDGASKLADSSITDNGTSVASANPWVGTSSSTVPIIGIIGATTTGIAMDTASSNGRFFLVTASARRTFGVDTNAQSVGLSSNTSFGWNSSATDPAATAADTILTRKAAANLQFGSADAAAPVAQTLSFQSVVTGTSNTAGVSPTLQLSLGTGNALPKPWLINRAAFGGSGTTPQTAILGQALFHTTANLITNNTATLFCRQNAANSSSIALIIRYTVEVADATNTQAETGIVTISGVVNSASTQTLAAVVKSANAQAVSSGTLTVTFTSVTNGGSVDVKVTSNSSLTPTTNRAIFEIINLSGQNSISLF